jgi:hypothetical protein
VLKGLSECVQFTAVPGTSKQCDGNISCHRSWQRSCFSSGVRGSWEVEATRILTQAERDTNCPARATSHYTGMGDAKCERTVGSQMSAWILPALPTLCPVTLLWACPPQLASRSQQSNESPVTDEYTFCQPH